MKEKPSYYAIIPAEVRYAKDLTPNAKLLYAEITALSQKENFCWASNKYFSELYDVSPITISRWISILVDKGFIIRKITYKKGTKQIDKRYLQLNQWGINNNENRSINQIVKDNNTSNNNTSNNKLFKKPSVNDVELYCIERDNKIDAISFVNFYESKGWMVGKNKMKDWRACVRTWEMRAKNKKTYAPKSMSKLDAQINEWQKAKELL